MQADTTNEKLYRILHGTTAVTSTLTGGIWLQQRPMGSKKEDIVLNCLTFRHGNPAEAMSNVNVYVPYKERNIGGQQQTVPDTARLKSLSAKVLTAIKAASVTDCLLEIQSEETIQDDTAGCSMRNIRVHWTIAEHE